MYARVAHTHTLTQQYASGPKTASASACEGMGEPALAHQILCENYVTR